MFLQTEKIDLHYKVTIEKVYSNNRDITQSIILQASSFREAEEIAISIFTDPENYALSNHESWYIKSLEAIDFNR